MKMKDALNKMETLFPNNTVSVTYSVSKTDKGEEHQNCNVICLGEDIIIHRHTWGKCFLAVEQILSEEPLITEPELEDTALQRKAKTELWS